MKKYCLDLQVAGVGQLSERHTLLKLTHGHSLPDMMPGQFVEIRIDGSPSTFLRRPVSINYVDRERNELWLLVAAVGEGTRRLTRLQVGEQVNVIMPLGNGFSLPSSADERFLLVGGGVGVAPLLYLGSVICARGGEPTFLLGARSASELLEMDMFHRLGRVFVTTEDGTAGEKGFVTNHSILSEEHFDKICTCGPKPMMKAVMRYAEQNKLDCEASLENMMACGLGACLCCVEKTAKGNVCVCKEGPVFNTKDLLWLR